MSGVLGRKRPALSVGAKLVGVVLLTTLVALTVALGAMVAYDLRIYHEAWLADMSTQAELLGQTTAPALAFDDVKLARENLGLLRLRPKVRAAAVFTPAGAVFATYSVSASENHFPKLPEADGVSVRGAELVVFKRIVTQGEVLGTVYLRAEYELYDRVRSYAGIAMAVALVAMLVAFVLSSWLQKLVTRPIQAIGSIAREVIEQRDYSRRAEKVSDDEIGDLVIAFNGMMAEIERRTEEVERSLRENSVEVVERRAAQMEVMRLNVELEQRVGERTAQLEQMNKDLAVAMAAAERANLAKSDFISSMSHELRTPLNAILGFGQLLNTEAYEPPAEKRKQFTRHIISAGNHLLQLINEILDLARIESSNVVLTLETVALDELLAECRTMVEAAANERGIQMHFPAGSSQSVLADRTRLKQILLNLLSNAIKYNVQAGTVVVSLSSTSTGQIRITVQDTGPGLRPEQAASLFQPFNRLGQEAGPVEGTGIGLVVTKRLVELMGGTIDVASTVGVGSTFWVVLRTAGTAERAVATNQNGDIRPATQSHATQPNAAQPLLLQIEDNPANQHLVEEIVSLRGDLRQMSAPDAERGIALARIHLPDVILLDINLPGLSGLDALAVLRVDPSTAHIRVVAVTANAMQLDKVRGLAAGFFRYITKPINVDELNEAIDSALDVPRGHGPRGAP